MIVFAVLMDQSGLTKRAGGIVVVNKTEHQLPMFVITFEATAQSHAYAAAGLPGMGSFGGSGTAAFLRLGAGAISSGSSSTAASRISFRARIRKDFGCP